MSKPLNLTAGREGAAPLWMLASGALSPSSEGEAPRGWAARAIAVTAARWFSTRGPLTLVTILPGETMTPAQGDALYAQLASLLDAREAEGTDPQATQARSAALTGLAQLVGTAHAPGWGATADRAASRIFALIAAEKNPRLRAHAIMLLQVFGDSLGANDRARAKTLLQSLVRVAPPYADLKGPWRFAMASDPEFHDGEVAVLQKTHGFVKTTVAPDAPAAPDGSWQAFRAPFKTADGDPIEIYARPSELADEDHEMGEPFFIGVLINRHAQLGSFDLVASATRVEQRGYKLMMNSQCAGLTTRFILHERFPDADLYSSYDSTQFETLKKGGEVSASEGQDCFVAILQGMAHKETHAQLEERIRKAQWNHAACAFPGFVQFIGPANEAVVARFEDVGDGRPAYSNAFLDFEARAVVEDLRASATPRDPGCAPSQVGGDAAAGLDWAAGSLDRVTRYSEFWVGLPGKTEFQYAFQSGGFYDQSNPPDDVEPSAVKQELGRLPSVCRYYKVGGALKADVMFHSYLSHAGKEYKRLLCAAEAHWRALDGGWLPKTGPLATPFGQRGALLLMMAGLLDFPGETTALPAIWALALETLNLPSLPGALVDGCITPADHDHDHYYGSIGGLQRLEAAVKKADPAAYARLSSSDPTVGRARELALPAAREQEAKAPAKSSSKPPTESGAKKAAPKKPAAKKPAAKPAPKSAPKKSASKSPSKSKAKKSAPKSPAKSKAKRSASKSPSKSKKPKRAKKRVR